MVLIPAHDGPEDTTGASLVCECPSTTPSGTAAQTRVEDTEGHATSNEPSRGGVHVVVRNRPEPGQQAPGSDELPLD